MGGKADDAHQLISEQYESSLKSIGPKHAVTAEKGAVLAMTLAAKGDRSGALKAFARAIPILLSSSRQSDSEGTSRAANGTLLKVILNAYIELLSDVEGTEFERHAGVDAAAEAFRIADVVRSSSVQAAFAASSARAAAGNLELADLVRREQDARKQISAMFGLLANALSVSSDQQDAQAIKSLRTRIDNLRNARAALAQEIEGRFPEYAELINPKPATVDRVQQSLHPGEALIATYVSDGKTYVWAVPKDGKAVFHAAQFGRDRIAAVVKDLRRALDLRAATLGDIPTFDVRLSHRLYETLLEPVKSGWNEATSVLVVAHQALGQLPFSVLVTRDAPLPGESGRASFLSACRAS